MKPHNIILAIGICLATATSHAATTCSKMNLTRCMDSVCGINATSNPAARCQYCGTSNAGTPPTKSGMQSLSVGQSSSNTISAKELKNAPTDPTARYTWAATQCINKISGCTPDDVSDAYDKLIEQSCRAAGISATVANLRASAAKPVTKTQCNTDIKSCIVDDTRCTADWRECADDENFNKFFSQCSVSATGCDEHLASIRSELITERDNSIKNIAAALDGIVKSYQQKRESKLATAQAQCKNNKGRDECVASVCERSMKNKCGAGFESEKSMAIQLCKFYDVACDTLR